MQGKMKLMVVAAAALIAGTTGALAQGYGYGYGGGAYYGYGPGYGPGYPAPPRATYYYRGPGWGAYNGANHPTPHSTQGDVGPEGNNNGTLTGVYRGW